AMAEVSASDAPTEGTKYGSGSSTGAPDYPHGTRRDPHLTTMCSAAESTMITQAQKQAVRRASEMRANQLAPRRQELCTIATLTSKGDYKGDTIANKTANALILNKYS
ncbi:hypothetical protein, partial [Roseovarius sp. D0-M9]|uniref:hypothetical protein n=1 Tax=Roseovarius sp. D0-M9 TaxID=3127117 RepID=UPI00300F9B67